MGTNSYFWIFAANLTNISCTRISLCLLYAHGSHSCSRLGAHRGLNTIFLNTNNPNDTNNFLHADFTLFLIRTRILLCFFNAHGSHGSHGSCSRRGAHCYWNTRLLWTQIIRMTRIFFWHAEARSAMLTFECWMLNCCVWPQCGIAQWWISMLTWWLLNENDTNEINTDSTRSFVITHCLCSVLKLESLYSFSPTIRKQAFIVLTYRKCFILFLAMAKFKQACFAHDLSKKFQIFTAVHNSMFKIQQRSYFFLI